MTTSEADDNQLPGAAHLPGDLWRDFPKTAPDFEARFATEDDCRAYWSKARWGDTPACAACASTRLWSIRKGKWFECADCGHQTSLTSGTLLDRTRKPLKTWFRAIFEISTHRTGISAKDLQRIMGFGSYGTPPGRGCTSCARRWCAPSASRSALSWRSTRRSAPFSCRGGKGGPNKELFLVAAEANGRVRLAHADNNDAGTLKKFADGQIARDATVTTDGHAGYSAKSLGERPHEAVVQTKAEKKADDVVQACHWTISLLKRWLLGTHAGAVSPKHLQAYLDEFAFRHNRRRTNGTARIAARVIEQLVARAPLTMKSLVADTQRTRWFTAKPGVAAPELTA